MSEPNLTDDEQFIVFLGGLIAFCDAVLEVAKFLVSEPKENK